MGGYRDFDVIDCTPRETHTVISDSLKKEFDEMEPERKDKVIKLLQAKVRMLEQSMKAEVNRYEMEQAAEDRKFFLDYRADGVRKISDAQREVAKRATDNIDDVDLDKYLRKKMAQNLGLACDENGYLITMTEEETVVAAKDLPPDGYEMLDMTPVEPIPTKVTLDENGPDEMHIIVDKRYYEILMPKVDETETHLLIKAKKRG